MRRLDQLCHRLEDRPRLRGVRQELQDDLKSEYECVAPFLRPTGDEAPRYPCPNPSGPGCPRHVLVQADGSRRAVCGCTPKECCPVVLNQNEVQILAFDTERFARYLRQVLGIQAPTNLVEGDEDMVTLGTIRTTLGKRLPVVLLMAPSSQAAEARIGKIEHTYKQGAVLVTPTGNLIDAGTEGRIHGSAITWLILADLLFANSKGLIAKCMLVDPVTQKAPSARSQADVVTADDHVFRKEGQLVHLALGSRLLSVERTVPLW